jgi:hypothetical protein
MSGDTHYEQDSPMKPNNFGSEPFANKSIEFSSDVIEILFE